MKMRNRVTITDEATQFTTAIADGATEVETIYGIRADGLGKISLITLKSKDNLPWSVELLDSNSNIIARKNFLKADGIYDLTLASYCYCSEVNWPLIKRTDLLTKVQVRNLSGDGTAKTAGVSGYLSLIVIDNKG
jgi:hypothetical protein